MPDDDRREKHLTSPRHHRRTARTDHRAVITPTGTPLSQRPQSGADQIDHRAPSPHSQCGSRLMATGTSRAGRMITGKGWIGTTARCARTRQRRARPEQAWARVGDGRPASPTIRRFCKPGHLANGHGSGEPGRLRRRPRVGREAVGASRERRAHRRIHRRARRQRGSISSSRPRSCLIDHATGVFRGTRSGEPTCELYVSAVAGPWRARQTAHVHAIKARERTCSMR
jgi:hypothetical protein